MTTRPPHIGGRNIDILPSKNEPGEYQHRFAYSVSSDNYFQNDSTTVFANRFNTLSHTDLQRRTTPFYLSPPSNGSGTISWTFNYGSNYAIKSVKITLHCECKNQTGVIIAVRPDANQQPKVLPCNWQLENREFRCVKPIDASPFLKGSHGFVLTVNLISDHAPKLFPKSTATYELDVDVRLEGDVIVPPMADLGGTYTIDEKSANVDIVDPNGPIIVSGFLPNRVICRVHSEVLRQRWPFYYDAGCRPVVMANVREVIVKAAMEYMYTGEIRDVIQTSDDWWELLRLADNGQFKSLKARCEQGLLKHVTTENAEEISRMAKASNASGLANYAESIKKRRNSTTHSTHNSIHPSQSS